MKPLTLGLIAIGAYLFLNNQNKINPNTLVLNPAENQEKSTGATGQKVGNKIVAYTIKGEDKQGDYIQTVYTDGTITAKAYR